MVVAGVDVVAVGAGLITTRTVCDLFAASAGSAFDSCPDLVPFAGQSLFSGGPFPVRQWFLPWMVGGCLLFSTRHRSKSCAGQKVGAVKKKGTPLKIEGWVFF